MTHSVFDNIEMALEGVKHSKWFMSPWHVEEDASAVRNQSDGSYICNASSDSFAAYIAACNPVAISAILAEARKAEAMTRKIAEKDARIAALEAGISDLVEIARQGVPSIPPDGPTSPEHQAAYEATGFTLVEIRNLARTLLQGKKP